MEKLLKVLVVEDSEDDAHLLLLELQQGGYKVEYHRVDTPDEMKKSLEAKKWDAIISDYSLPRYGAFQALETLKESGLDLPFIIVSGPIGEDLAASAMKAGAGDFLLKGNLKKLVPVVEREIREAQQRAEHRRADETLRRSEEQYRILFDSNPQPMWVYDAATLGFLAVNQSAIRHYGYTREEFLAMTIRDIRPPDDVAEPLDHTAADLSDLDEAEVWRHRKKDGEIVDVEITSHRISFLERSVILVLAQDVTNRRLAEAELRQKSNELATTTQQLWQTSRLAVMGELAASIAHELNNPLATVGLRAESLMAQLSADDSNRRALEIIVEETDRMSKLVSNLLEFSRRRHRQISTLDVQKEFEKTLEFIDYYLRSREVKVVQEFAANLPTILADRQQLRQVFINLITNASDAMAGGGTLTVRAFPIPPEGEPLAVAIEFADNGDGIAQETLPKIWKPFFTTKPEGKGTGLGLAICRRTIEEHQGAIDIESQQGQGTTVRIMLPANGKE